MVVKICKNGVLSALLAAHVSLVNVLFLSVLFLQTACLHCERYLLLLMSSAFSFIRRHEPYYRIAPDVTGKRPLVGLVILF